MCGKLINHFVKGAEKNVTSLTTRTSVAAITTQKWSTVLKKTKLEAFPNQ